MPELQLSAPQKGDIWDILDKIGETGDTLLDLYERGVKLGIIKPEKPYVPPAPPVAPPPVAPPPEPVWKKPWFLPVIIGGGVGTIGLLYLARKKRR